MGPNVVASWQPRVARRSKSDLTLKGESSPLLHDHGTTSSAIASPLGPHHLHHHSYQQTPSSVRAAHYPSTILARHPSSTASGGVPSPSGAVTGAYIAPVPNASSGFDMTNTAPNFAGTDMRRSVSAGYAAFGRDAIGAHFTVSNGHSQAVNSNAAPAITMKSSLNASAPSGVVGTTNTVTPIALQLFALHPFSLEEKIVRWVAGIDFQSPPLEDLSLPESEEDSGTHSAPEDVPMSWPSACMPVAASAPLPRLGSRPPPTYEHHISKSRLLQLLTNEYV